ncbi:hypothetical protein DM02DRAFT_659872 [Periconia macrospinosa]|uniref:Rhodopsin domain-containing protein n=1 Tax=Periconia macrospinosa TaxID=97972 RepID=A0A2V1DC88_9PLEO|nr:hypothetical protein DM02DRAFT_659872 [Periconia macrospinosa]
MAPLDGRALVPRQFSYVLTPTVPINIAHESRGTTILAGNAVFQVIGTLFFLARVYSRSVMIKSWKAEDTVLAAAWKANGLHDKVFATGFSVCQYAQVYLGFGHHLAYIFRHIPTHLIISQQWGFASAIMLPFALSLPKLSICLTYLRLFQSDVWGRRLIKFLILVVCVPVLPFFIHGLLQCKPISAFWNEGRPVEKCGEDISGLWVAGAMSIFVDVALVVIVLPQVLRLHLPTRQRWSLILIVAMGLLAGGAGLVRIIRVGTTLKKEDFDPSWDMYDLSIWSAMEIYVSLICASAPGMKPLVTKVLPKFLGSSLGSNGTLDTTHKYPPGSVELSLSQQRRGTIGSARVRRNTHDSILEEGEGPYVEVGRGVDEDDEEASVKSKGSLVLVAERLPKIEEVKTPSRDVH